MSGFQGTFAESAGRIFTNFAKRHTARCLTSQAFGEPSTFTQPGGVEPAFLGKHSEGSQASLTKPPEGWQLSSSAATASTGGCGRLDFPRQDRRLESKRL